MVLRTDVTLNYSPGTRFIYSRIRITTGARFAQVLQISNGAKSPRQ